MTGDSGYAGVPMTAHHNTLLVNGKGQANEGKGHDAFDGFSYDLLNQLRIADVKVEKNAVTIRAEVAATYKPELGLTRFTRWFTYKPGEGFEVKDELAAKQPTTFTTLLHADDKITADSKTQFTIGDATTKLIATLVAPADFKAEIEPNILTAPGKPGSVDKGEQQQRGERLAISNGKPSVSAQFILKLKLTPK